MDKEEKINNEWSYNNIFSKILEDKHINFFNKLIKDFHDGASKLLELTNPIYEAIKETDLLSENTLEILKKFCWLMSCESLPYKESIEFMQLLVKENLTQKEVDAVFINFYFSDNFDNLSYLVKYLKENIPDDRYKIIEDCFILLKKYSNSNEINCANLVVPTLMTHIDYYKSDIKNIITKHNEEVKNLIKQKTESNTVGIKEMFEYEKDGIEIFDLSIDLILNHIFKGKNFTDFKGDELYRNKILHGQSLNYGNNENVLKSFLVLEYLVSKHTELKKKYNINV